MRAMKNAKVEIFYSTIDGMHVCTEEVVFEMMLIKNLSAIMDTAKKCAATNKGKRIFICYFVRLWIFAICSSTCSGVHSFCSTKKFRLARRQSSEQLRM